MHTSNDSKDTPFTTSLQQRLQILGDMNHEGPGDPGSRFAKGCEGETIYKAQQGDIEAWEILVRQNIGWVLCLCRQWVGSTAQAEDLTQDVWLRVFQNIRTYRGEVAEFRTWLRRIVRNLLIDDYRRARRERNTISYDSADDRMKNAISSIPARCFNPEASIKKLECKAALCRAFRTLSPKKRQAVILRDLHGLTYEEISRLMSTPVGTVKSRVNRGRIEMAPRTRRYKTVPLYFSPSASAAA